MRITLEDSDDGGHTPGEAAKRENGGNEIVHSAEQNQTLSRMNTASKARLQAIKDRVASHTPYTATRSRRRGMDGVQNAFNGPAQHEGVEEEGGAVFRNFGLHSPSGSSFASKLLSVATTPLRAAWGIVASQLRTPSASPLADGLANEVQNANDGNNVDSVMAQDKVFVASPSLPEQAVDPNAEGQSPSRRRVGGVGRPNGPITRRSPRKAGATAVMPVVPAGGIAAYDVNDTSKNSPDDGREVKTPFDGVLDMLKDGPLAGGTPARHPPPSMSAMKGMPQSMRAPRSAQPAFTFDMTKQRLLSSVPVKPAGVLGDVRGQVAGPAQDGTPMQTIQTKKRMMFGSQRGSAMKGMPLAWTPLRATPLAARSTGAARTRFAPSSRFALASQAANASGAPASRKRRVDDVHGPSQTLDDGSVSLLDMQRRRRFKPSEDPGSVQRRSWRAGRTPYAHMARHKRRIEDGEATADPYQVGVGATPDAQGPVPSPSPGRATTDTARRILETLDSMEEKIRKSKERVSPVEARMYTLDATAAPPPGASLGGAMLSSKTTTPVTMVATAPQATPTSATTVPKPIARTITPSDPSTMTTPISGIPKPFLSVQEATPALFSGTGVTTEAEGWKAVEATKKIFGASPASDRPSGGKKKRSRMVGGDEDRDKDINRDEVSEPSANKAFGLRLAAEKPVDVSVLAPSFHAASTPPAAPAEGIPPSSLFVFGSQTNNVKVSVDKALQGVTPAPVATKFVFGKEKCPSGKPLGTLSPPAVVPAAAPLFSFSAAPKKEEPTELAEKAQKKADAKSVAQAAPTQSGWGSDFLKKNAVAATAAASAAAEEAQGSAPAVAPTTAPAFTFVAPVASNFSAPAMGTDAPVTKPAFTFGASTSMTPVGQSAASAFTFGASAPSKEVADKGALVAEKEPIKDQENESQGFKFGASAVATTALEDASLKPAFTFGTVDPADNKPAEKKPETTTTTTSGWGAEFLAKNAQQASAATAAVEKEVNKDVAQAPSFKFGAPATDTPGDAPTASEAPIAAPAFKFGASNTDAPATKPAFQFGSSPPSTTALAVSDSPAAPAPASGTATTTTSGWGADFLAKNVQQASAATAAVEKEVSKDAAPAGFVFGASSTPALGPKESTGGFGSSFGSQTAASTAPAASPAPAFGAPPASSGLAFGSAPPTVSGFAFGGQTPAAPKPATTGFAFGNQLASGASAPAFGAPSSAPASANPFGGPASVASTGPAATTGSFGAPSSTFGFGAPTPGGFGGFGAPSSTGGFGAPAPFGGASSTAAFGAPASQGSTNPNPNPFGQPSGQFGAPVQNPGFQPSSFGGPSAFPPPSGPSQMIPNNPDNPFGGGASAGGFNLGSTGTGGTQSRSEGRRKVRVRRKH